MKPHCARSARSIFGDCFALLLPILVFARRDVSYQRIEEGDSLSMLQGMGAVHVTAGHVSVRAQPDSRSPPIAANISTEDVNRPALLQHLNVRGPPGIVFLVVFCVSVCIVVLICGLEQAEPEKKSSLDPTGGLPGQENVSPASLGPPAGVASPPPPMPSEKPAAPVPICPALVMPTEARLLIPKHAIPQSAAGGELVIFGLSGSPLLHAFIREGADHRLLQISMWHDIGAPVASIRLPDHNSCQPWTRCEILGPGNTLYGMLKVQPGGWGVAAQSGVELMVINGDPEDLQLTIKSVTGMSLATAQCSSSASGGVEHVVIKVGQGNDVVLIVVSALALLLMSAGGHHAQSSRSQIFGGARTLPFVSDLHHT
mmetsp:Transcript_136674/g.237694  ORF Transcript_136674/g.237694 Transcript_136674/m.237694 type:complete len:371 (+) Transcript_136674:97-1209(+)